MKLTKTAYLQPYKIIINKHSAWSRMSWATSTPNEMKLGVIDFRNIPTMLEKENSTIEKSLFYKVLISMQKEKQPLLE